METLFHRSILSNQAKWTDDRLRGKLWTHGKSYPHKFLTQKVPNVQLPKRLFIICFYPSGELADRFEERDFPISPTALLRVNEAHVLEAGFQWVWDDGFNPNEVRLYWREDVSWPVNAERSTAGVLIDHVDILTVNGWQSVRANRTSS